MKLSQEEFWTGLRESAGIYSRAVRFFKKEYDVDISRISVRDRALKDVEQLKDIKEQNIDIAEEGIQSLMRSKNESIRFRSCEFTLKNLGKGRGYVERQEIEIDGDFNLVVEFVEPE